MRIWIGPEANSAQTHLGTPLLSGGGHIIRAAWRVLITLEAEFCTEAVEEALVRHSAPEIFNTDQGRQFNSTDFIKVLAAREIKIGMPLGDCRPSPAGNRWQGVLV